jgi:hypothetical protein
VTFLALYRGESLQGASLVAVSTDPDLVAHVASVLLENSQPPDEPDDPAMHAIRRGRRKALRLIQTEARGPGRPPENP